MSRPRPPLLLPVASLVLTAVASAQAARGGDSPYTPAPTNLDWKPIGLEPEPWRPAPLKDWVGLRFEGGELGMAFAGRVIWEGSRAFDGGLEDRFRDRLFADAAVDWSLEKSFGLKGTSLRLEGYHREGPSSEEDTATLQGISSLDGPEETEVREAYWRQEFGGGFAGFKLGRLDAGRDIQRFEYMRELQGRAFAYTPTIYDYPTRPDQGDGVELFVTPEPEMTFRLDVIDRNDSPGLYPDQDGRSYMILLEGAFEWWDEQRRGRIRMGTWRHTGAFDDVNGVRRNELWGWWVGVEKDLLRVEDGRGGAFAVSAFSQLAKGDRFVQFVRDQWVLGARVQGLIPGRARDSLGLALSKAYTNKPQAGGVDGNELVVETFYRVELLETLVLQPDLQFWHQPGGDRDREDMWVFQVRAAFVF
ncbi:MAG: carbohydrate porin [Planctomycetota bacterium]